MLIINRHIINVRYNTKAKHYIKSGAFYTIDADYELYTVLLMYHNNTYLFMSQDHDNMFQVEYVKYIWNYTNNISINGYTQIYKFTNYKLLLNAHYILSGNHVARIVDYRKPEVTIIYRH